MAEKRVPDSTEAIAFSVILKQLPALESKLNDVEQALGQVLSLLTKIITLLEAQQHHAEVPVAPWEATYQELHPPPAPIDVTAQAVSAPEAPPMVLKGWRRWVFAVVHGDAPW